MQIAYRWINRDLGKAEFIFSIIIISILLTLLVNKSLSLFALTERRLVETTVSNIQTALSLQSAIKTIKKNDDDMVELAEGMNPAYLMQSSIGDYKEYIGNELENLLAKQAAIRPITNYLGEMYDPDITSLERGNWYFDYNGKLFIYLVKHKEIFGVARDGVSVLKYSVSLNYDDVNNNQLYEAGKDILNSVSFVRIKSDE